MPIKPENRSKYPKDWRDISRRIRERDGDCCKECGVPNGAYIVRDKNDLEKWRYANGGDLVEGYEPDAIKVILTVAHLDHDETNCSDDNLAALCQLHHLRHDAQQHADNARQTRIQKRKRAAKEAGQKGLFS
jgi:hypothetical protein